jgi:hypothetical protein
LGLKLFSAAGLIGLAAALWVALAPHEAMQTLLPGDGLVAARVNGSPITMLEYERAAQAVQNDRRNPVGPAEVERILDTLIDEELLAQEAVRLDLVTSDRAVRAAAVQGVMRLILSDIASVEPSEAELRAFYDNNPDLFSHPVRTWVRHLEVDAAREDDVAAIATALRDGASFGEIHAGFPAVTSRPVPDRMIRAEDLSQYLGGGLTDLALAAGEGTVMGPLMTGNTANFLWVVEREDQPRPSFEEVRDRLEDEWRRRAEDRAVADYVARLRARSSIEIEAFAE